MTVANSASIYMIVTDIANSSASFLLTHYSSKDHYVLSETRGENMQFALIPLAC